MVRHRGDLTATVRGRYGAQIAATDQARRLLEGLDVVRSVYHKDRKVWPLVEDLHRLLRQWVAGNGLDPTLRESLDKAGNYGRIRYTFVPASVRFPTGRLQGDIDRDQEAIRAFANQFVDFMHDVWQNAIYPLPLAVCPATGCQKLFLKARPDQIYCSSVCREAHWRATKMGEEPGYYARKAKEARKAKQHRSSKKGTHGKRKK